LHTPILHRIQYITLVVLACCLCWSKQQSSIPIAILVILFLLQSNLFNKLKQAFNAPSIWLYLSVVIIYTVGLLHSGINTESMACMERKLIYIILPIILATSPLLSLKQWEQLMAAYCISCIGVMCFCLAEALYITSLGNASLANEITYENLARPIMHPGYLSNFLLLAIFWLLCPLMGYAPVYYISPKVRYAGVVIFIICIGLLTSKTAILILFAFAVYFIGKVLLSSASTKVKVIIASSSILLCVFALALVKWLLAARLNFDMVYTNTGTAVRFENSVGSRFAAAKEALELIKLKPLFGYGTGTANTILLQQLNTKGYSHLVQMNMHVHNQVLRTLLDVGIIGLVAIIALWWYTTRKIFKQGHIIILGLTIIVGINILTDDMLEIQAGVVFFTLFNALLYYSVPPAQQAK
jgi:O-antigen ligase